MKTIIKFMIMILIALMASGCVSAQLKVGGATLIDYHTDNSYLNGNELPITVVLSKNDSNQTVDVNQTNVIEPEEAGDENISVFRAEETSGIPLAEAVSEIPEGAILIDGYFDDVLPTEEGVLDTTGETTIDEYATLPEDIENVNPVDVPVEVTMPDNYGLSAETGEVTEAAEFIPAEETVVNVAGTLAVSDSAKLQLLKAIRGDYDAITAILKTTNSVDSLTIPEIPFTPEEYSQMSVKEQRDALLSYSIALATVLKQLKDLNTITGI